MIIDYGIDYNSTFVYVGLSESTRDIWLNFINMSRRLGILSTKISAAKMDDGRWKVIFQFKRVLDDTSLSQTLDQVDR